MRQRANRLLVECAAGLLLLAGCAKKGHVSSGRNEARTGEARPGGRPTAPRHHRAVREGKVMKLDVTSSAFQNGQGIPKKYAYRGEGDNVSPPLAWSGAPEGTKSFVVICEDPDAPSPKHPAPKPWVHWVLFDIPATVTKIEEGRSAGTPGRNDFKETAWGGPLPPRGSGKHRYFFRVYALDTTLNLPKGATKNEVLRAADGHILAKGQLYGTYER